MGRFKKGLVLGGLLGAGLMWLNATVKGKEYRAKILAHLEPLYNELKTSIMKLEGPTKEMWDALVERAVEEYAAKKELAMDVKNNLIRELSKKWDKLENDIRGGK
jgi:gas vesicle protein